MAVYDKEDKDVYDNPDDYSPESIKNAEDSAAESTDDEQKDLLNSLSEDEKKLYDSLAEDERDIFLKLKKEEQGLDKAPAELNDRLNSFYKEDSIGKKGAGNKSLASTFSGKKKQLGVIAGAIGIPGLLFGVAFIPGLLSIFKLENFVQNIDTATFSRFNAAFDRRSDKWMKAYIKLRLTEIDGETKGDNLFFRSNKVDTNNPINDWYRTLRTNRFEEKVFEKSGIKFTSVEVAPGKFSLAKITVRDVPINANWRTDISISEALTDRGQMDAILNSLGPDLDRFVETEVYGSNKESRKAIKTAVNDNTKSWQVFKRRQVRRDIQNMTGIGNWRLFERTRDKFDAKKIDIQRKILQKVLPETRTGLFIGCLLGANKCPGQSDPASPEARDVAKASAEQPDTGTSQEIDEDGNIKQTPDDPDNPNSTRSDTPSPDGTPARAADDAADALSSTLDGSADEILEASPVEEYIRKLVTQLGGNPYTKIWSYLKKITHLHNFFASNTIGKLVLNATRTQYMTAYATMGIALSQMKSGDIQSTANLFSQTSGSASVISGLANTAQQGLSIATRNGQVSQYMTYLDDAEKSEAWILYSAGRNGNSAKAFAAEENSDKGRSYYCELDETKKKESKIHYVCPEDALNGGNGDKIKDIYMNSLGVLIAPIAAAVDAINSSPIGSLVNVASSFMDNIADATIGRLMEKLLSVTGADATIGNIMTHALTRLLGFMGAGLKYYPGKAGTLNYHMMGGAATAEATGRLSGGIASTQESLEYSNKLAAEWKRENIENMDSFERYFALSNPKSITSRGLMAILSASPKDIFRDSINPSKSLGNYASLISGAVYADDGVDISASTVAEWSGVPTYDIPQICIDLDPLSPDYLNRSTNAPPEVPRDYATLSDSAKFWDAVYANLSGSPEEKEQQAQGIYNCALFDARVMGSMGYIQGGYDKDGGLEANGNTAAPIGGGGGSADLGSAPGFNGYTIPCNGIPSSRVATTNAGGKEDALNWSGIKDSGVIGKSSDNKDIKIYIRDSCVKDNVKTVVIAASIHGSENGGQVVAHEMLFNAKLPENVRIIAIPEINSYGLSQFSVGGVARKNKNGVNLNRNFNINWNGGPSDDNERNPSDPDYRGPTPESEPETKALVNFLNSLNNVSAFFAYHDNLNYAASSGGTAASIGKVYADTAGMPNVNSKGFNVIPQHGSLDYWFSSTKKVPTVLVELSNASLSPSQASIDKQVAAVLAVTNISTIKAYNLSSTPGVQ